MAIKFPLPLTIPSNAKIIKATLTILNGANPIATNQGEKTVSIPKDLHVLTKSWERKSTDWNKPWTVLGGDFETKPLFTSQNSQLDVWEDFDVTEAISEFVSGTKKNHGFIILFKLMKPDKAVKFFSSHNKNQTSRPKLTIVYDLGTEIGKIKPAHSVNTITKIHKIGRSQFLLSNSKGFVSINLYRTNGKKVYSVNSEVPFKSDYIILPKTKGVFLLNATQVDGKNFNRIIKN